MSDLKVGDFVKHKANWIAGKFYPGSLGLFGVQYKSNSVSVSLYSTAFTPHIGSIIVVCNNIQEVRTWLLISQSTTG